MLASTAAFAAADQPIIAPAPAWVKPVAIPLPSAKPDEAAVRLLLSDRQVLLEPGSESLYQAVTMRVQTPQGLSTGNLAFPWRPDSQTLTVHKLRIVRGATVIDVLGSGQTFTVARREANLESAVLDGVLTASIQPEGLQVGDTLEWAVTIVSRDPTLKGHAETLALGLEQLPTARTHLRLSWPTTFPVRVRSTGGLAPLKPVRSGPMTSVEVTLDDVVPAAPPKGAPPRFAQASGVEATAFAQWSDLARLMSPLYASAAVLPSQGPLAAEAAKLRALPDPKARAEAALALVQNKIRYVALALGTGNLVPADAATTWSRRYGDCKAKTALLIALLADAGIEAEPVLVSSQLGDGMDARLPMAGVFDHVLVRATIAGKPYWLDGTRTGDAQLDRLRVPGFGWGLPLRAQGAALVRMLPAPLDTPDFETVMRIDASAGITAPVPVTIETVIRGDGATASAQLFANLAGAQRERALREYWRGQYDFIEADSVAAVLDPATGDYRLSLAGKAKMDWSKGWYETDGTSIGYKANFTREPGPNRDAPFAVPYPMFTRMTQTIKLPASFFGASKDSRLKADADRTVAGIEYKRRGTRDGNAITITASTRSIAPEFAFVQAPAAQAALRELADQTVYVMRPATFQPNAADLAAMLATTPTTAGAFFDCGLTLLRSQRYPEAIGDFDRSAALDPRNAFPIANRGIARYWNRDLAGATKDFDAAAVIDPRNPVLLRGRAMAAGQKGDFRAAVAFFTESLAVDQSNSFAFGARAQANRQLGNVDAALADAAAGLKLEPTNVELYLLRANLFRAQGKNDAVAIEADALVTANPGNSYAQVAAAKMLMRIARPTEAMRLYERALAIKPEAYIYVNRSETRPKTDVAGRRADLDAALKLDPGFTTALVARALLDSDAGAYGAAVAGLTAALATQPDQLSLLNQRGMVFTRAGDRARAAVDFAAARLAAKGSASRLNDLCYEKAMAGVALEAALVDCDAAVAKEPNDPPILDSRAFVLLRLGRLDAAIADYDRAIAIGPAIAQVLYGRALAWARKGEKGKASADATAARAIVPDIADRFKDFGIDPIL